MTLRKRIGIATAVLVVGALIGALVYMLVRYNNVSNSLQEVHDRLAGFDQKINQERRDVPAATEAINAIESASQNWRAVQGKVHNAVVQIFSQIAEADLLQPYKTPTQYPAYGSGFFIDEEGHIVTNAHVVNQAKSVWIQMPAFGKRIIDVTVVGVSPERDIALLKVNETDLALIKKTLGKVAYLTLGDSDKVRRSDEVLAIGYPLGQQSVKSTNGIISGREQHLIQMSAPINPGNSGGPLLNNKGEVVGINTANVPTAQNVGYIIPINDFKIVFDDLRSMKLVRKPFLGVIFNNATESLVEYLGNPHPGGCSVVEVVDNSTLFKAGVKCGDMIYEIDGHRLDLFGEMTVAWSEDKISLIDYVHRLSVGDNIKLVFYRKGKRKEVNVRFSQSELPFVHRVYPGFQDIDYEVFGGMVVQRLTTNHIHLLANAASGLTKFAEIKNQKKPVLVVTHIFPNSHVARARSLSVGSTIHEVNGKPVTTLEEYRDILKKADKEKFLTLRVSDNVARASDNVIVAVPFDKLLQQEEQLSRDFHFPLSEVAKELLQGAKILATK